MAWDQFVRPFLVVTPEDRLTVPVDLTQVNDAFGVVYARLLFVALPAAMPVAVACPVFQKKMTEAVTIAAGVKGW